MPVPFGLAACNITPWALKSQSSAYKSDTRTIASRCRVNCNFLYLHLMKHKIDTEWGHLISKYRRKSVTSFTKDLKPTWNFMSITEHCILGENAVYMFFVWATSVSFGEPSQLPISSFCSSPVRLGHHDRWIALVYMFKTYTCLNALISYCIDVTLESH